MGTIAGSGTICFALALVHALCAARIGRALGPRWGHVFGEVELVFPLWAALFLTIVSATDGWTAAAAYVGAQSFHEIGFIFVVTTVCSLRRVVRGAEWLIDVAARPLPIPRGTAVVVSALVLGPLLGSLVTEAAAMTITALSLRGRAFGSSSSLRLRYDLLATLFVNVSIGGTLSRFAAAPILVVADEWGWSSGYVARHFGGRALAACVINAAWLGWRHRAELARLGRADVARGDLKFIDVRTASGTALFLGGLILLGPAQRWWIEPVLHRLSATGLYLGATVLTAVIDNAALTYLAAQVPELPEVSRRAVVAGAVVGGGLTLLANAPNAAGYGLLKGAFPARVVRAGMLARAALTPTLVALAALWAA